MKLSKENVKIIYIFILRNCAGFSDWEIDNLSEDEIYEDPDFIKLCNLDLKDQK